MTQIAPQIREPVEATKRAFIPALWKFTVMTRQGERCGACRKVLGGPAEEVPQFDHVLPIELGGSHGPGNLQALCVPCHKAKTRDDIKRIRKAARLRRDADPQTRRQPIRKLRGRGFQKSDPLR